MEGCTTQTIDIKHQDNNRQPLRHAKPDEADQEKTTWDREGKTTFSIISPGLATIRYGNITIVGKVDQFQNGTSNLWFNSAHSFWGQYVFVIHDICMF